MLIHLFKDPNKQTKPKPQTLFRELHVTALSSWQLYVKVAPCILTDAMFATLLRAALQNMVLGETILLI